jgi:sorting nexin-4
MLDDNEDVFDSVTWETPSGAGAIHNPPSSGPGFIQSTSDSAEEPRPHDPKWEGYLITSVKDPVKELAETKDAYVSYLVSAKVRLLSCIPQHCDRTEPPAQTNLPIFSMPDPSARRRFQDFVFLRNHLKVDFPACVVPPLPDKHRLGTRATRVFNLVLTIRRVCDRR